MEGFGNSSLYSNFHRSEKRKRQQDQIPKRNEKKAKKFISPDPTVKSQIFSQDLIDHELDLNLREEEFLIELNLFYEGIEKYKKYKSEYEEMLQNKKNGRISLIGFASRLSMYQDMLEQRFEAAQKILSDPIDDIEREEMQIQQLELEVEELDKSVPQEVPPEAQITIDQMLRDADQINSENERMREFLLRKQEMNEKERNKLIDQQIKLESLENEEKRLDNQLKRDQEKLSKTPKIDEEQAIRNEKLKAELEERQKVNRQNKIQFVQKCQISEATLSKLQSEVKSLQSEQIELMQKRQKINEILGEIKKLADFENSLNENLSKADEEIEELKRKIGNQAEGLEKIYAKRDNLRKKAEEAEEKRKKLLLIEEELNRRRLEIEKADAEFTKDREEIEKLKKNIAEIEKEVERNKKIFIDMKQKTNDLQEELENKNIDFVHESSDAINLLEIKNLLKSD